MNLRKLDNEDIISVYNDHMRMDFPTEELKPIDVIQKLIKKKIYVCYGLYDNDNLLAYAFLVTSNLYLLLDYYAVCNEYRNKRIGSKFLNILKEKCKDYEGIIIEVEKIELAVNELEKVVRKRRIDFYKRNGALITKISSELFNVNYSIMCLPICNISSDDFVVSESLRAIYKQIIPSSLYSKYVKIGSGEELLTIYNENLEEIGTKTREEVHKRGLKHKVVHCWIIERIKEDSLVYFQQRSYKKADFAGMYDISCAGHIDAGEEAESAMLRELEEEIGLCVNKNDLKYIGRKFETYEMKNFYDDEICEMYILEVDKSTVFNLGEEVEDMVKLPFCEYEKWINGQLKVLEAISVKDNKKVKIHDENICPHIKEYNRQLFQEYEII